MRIHYAGALVVRKPNGSVISISPGYAACCSGDRALTIRKRAAHTYIRAVVTCMRCLKVLNAVSEECDHG